VERSEAHPGLQLDKLAKDVGDQKKQRDSLQEVTRQKGDGDMLARLGARRGDALSNGGATRFQAVTVSPLALHLSRTGALENAGICLHPIYGFAYLPGSGLKGMARAWAETSWAPAQSDAAMAWQQIREVFGWTSETDRDKPWLPAAVPEAPVFASSGTVAFHDAWPLEWPRLVVDITNSHHGNYYQKGQPPGDWEDPVPVSFLAVSPGTRIEFAVSGRDPDKVLMAKQWLTAALVHAGAGAKTNAGYGVFQLVNETPPEPASVGSRHFETELKLAAPAFLAGAEQEAGDCDLRGASLRGLLRWWWRTMHADFVDVATLRRLEALVWGDTQIGGAIRLAVGEARGATPQCFADIKDRYEPRPDFKRRHQLQDPPDRKTTQGLFYAAYGMADGSNRRWYREAGASWTVSISARDRRSDGNSIPAELLLRQAAASLWLLTRYGGVGSKSRKGFGSFADVDVEGITGIEDCVAMAAELRAAMGAPGDEHRATSVSSLGDMLQLEVETPWRNPWFAIDQLGFAAEAFAQDNAHQSRKKALGLPRQIHGPRQQPIGHQSRDTHEPPERLSAKQHRRHASPVHYHLAPSEDGTLTIRMTAFPSPDLPDLETSKAVLQDLAKHLEEDLHQRVRDHARVGTRVRVAPREANVDLAQATPLPKANERVEALLLEQKTKKGGWRAKHEASGMDGAIQNTNDVPGNAEPGQRVNLLVAFARPREIAFWWPTPDREAAAARPPRERPRGGKGARMR